MSQTVFTFSLRNGAGILFDATSAVLQDQTNTFGIKVIGTDQIIVAAGTALTHSGTGIYTYALTDPAPNLTYFAVGFINYIDPDTGNPSTIYAEQYATSAPSPTATGTISLYAARQMARQFTRNAQDSTMYNNVAIDTAIQIAADDWLRITKSSRVLTSVNLAQGSNIVPTMPANWKPELVFNFSLSLNGKVVCPTLNFVDPTELDASNAALYGNSSSLGSTNSAQQPSLIAFTENSPCAGLTGPGLCNQAYTVDCWWWEPFTAWIPGTMGQYSSASTYTAGDIVAVSTVSGNLYQSLINANTNHTPASSPTQWTLYATLSTTADPLTLFFNLPDDEMRVILTIGVRAFLQMAEPENVKTSQAAQDQFTAKARQFKGRAAGTRGGNVSISPLPAQQVPVGGWFPVG